MSSFKVLTDSCCDLPDGILKEYDIGVLPYCVSLGGRNYMRDRVDISIDYFFNQLESNKNIYPKTSFPKMDEISNFFVKYLETGHNILYISMTSKFSGGFQVILNTVETLRSDYPRQKIVIVDSTQVSVGEGLLAIQAARAREDGCSVYQAAEFVNLIKNDVKLFATVNSLSYLQRGGRIGKVSAIAGNILNIKPIIAVQNGELYPHSKVRGRKKAIEEIISLITKETENQKDDYAYAVFHTCSQAEAESIIDILKNKFSVDVYSKPMQIGSIIGAHIGPTALAIAVAKKYSREYISD